MRQVMKATLLYLALSSVVFAHDYRFVKIDVPNAVSTDARGINARGDIVGTYTDANDVNHGFLLRQGVFSSIDVPDAAFTGTRAINARGDIVGNFLDAGFVQHGFLLHDGQFTQIDYPGASATFAYGINNAGDLTGSHFDASGNERGYILRDGVFHNVHVPGGLTTTVYFAQDNGRVLVGDTGVLDGFHGFIRNKPGDFQLIDFPGLSSPCTEARWINQRGDIVGFFRNVCVFEDPPHGFLLGDGQYTQIDFPRSIDTKVLAINDDGVIVGNFTDKQGNLHGFKAVPEE
jgi:probable HAF family extracellular repeat protein